MVEEEGYLDRFTSKISDLFIDEDYELKTDTGCERKVWDRRIEGYLDAHFDEYISTYQVITSIDLERLEGRCEGMDVRVRGLKTFSLDMDAKVSNLETRVDTLKGKAK